jgi:hypothetical protein
MTSRFRPTIVSIAAARGIVIALSLAAGLSGCASYATPSAMEAGAVEMRQALEFEEIEPGSDRSECSGLPL